VLGNKRLRQFIGFAGLRTMTEQQDFADCVAQHIPFLHRVVRSLIRGDQMAEDIVQQTVLKALINADRFRFESSIRTWLASIAINEIRQAHRSRWYRRAVPLIIEAPDVDGTEKLQSPHENYETDERDLLVRKAVSRLPDTYRCVVELCDLQCLPMKEAADKLGLTLPAVKSRRHRARGKLRPLVVKLASKLR
jgi:RNA polymerase sigma-70 factor, ECF subfamily